MMKKIVLKVEIHNDRIKNKAMKAVSSLSGVESISINMKDKKITAIGDIDPVRVVAKIRKFCHAEILSVGPAKRIHDVFLSFRGEDTRSSFTSHLYTALQNAGIEVFRDDSKLQRGDHISKSLSNTIEQSQISLIVFSKNYANSRWCLDELEKIMKCHRTIGQKVVPVFYHVDPSEVRHQTGEFGISFQSLLNKISNEVELVLSWREALRQAASIAGFVIPNSRNESEAIKHIVENVVRLLDKTDLFIANNPVGVESRVEDMVQWLDQDIEQSDDVLILGMWGMGGVGKTTIAKAIYNKFGRNFEGRSFLANIREVWENNVGQVE